MVEFLRQHLDSGVLYSSSSSSSFCWKHVSNISYLSTLTSDHSLSKYRRLLKHFHVLQMEMASPSDLFSIYSKLLLRHFIGDQGESQLALKDSGENVTRVSTGKSSTITATTTTTTTTNPLVTPSSLSSEGSSVTLVGLKEKLSQKALKRLEDLRSIIERLVRGTIDLNDRMRHLYQLTSERLHYVFSMKQLSQLFRHLTVTLTAECSVEELLQLWHHQIFWFYGKRLSNPIDFQRYEQLYQTIVKKYFTNLINEQEILLLPNQFFSNLQVTESGRRDSSSATREREREYLSFRNGRGELDARCSELSE